MFFGRGKYFPPKVSASQAGQLAGQEWVLAVHLTALRGEKCNRCDLELDSSKVEYGESHVTGNPSWEKFLLFLVSYIYIKQAMKNPKLLSAIAWFSSQMLRFSCIAVFVCVFVFVFDGKLNECFSCLIQCLNSKCPRSFFFPQWFQLFYIDGEINVYYWEFIIVFLKFLFYSFILILSVFVWKTWRCASEHRSLHPFFCIHIFIRIFVFIFVLKNHICSAYLLFFICICPTFLGAKYSNWGNLRLAIVQGSIL